MASRKRSHDEINSEATSEPPTLLKQIRNAWQFACLMQYIQFFGSALKIDNELDVDMLEEECLRPNSEKLATLGLTMLKWVSSHRGLTLDIFDEYTRRQYLAKAPHLNPFGEEEDAIKFSEFDIFTKLQVLHQLSVWTFNNPDRIRERMEESRDGEQAGWRIEPYGYDREGRTYYLLDDNRLYRLTDVELLKPAPKKPKAKPKPKKAGSRSSKRQKLTNGAASDQDEVGYGDGNERAQEDVDIENGLGGAKWECIAVTIEEYRELIEKFRKSKDADEKEMSMGIVDDVMPELEKAEESKARKEAKRVKELDNLQRMATAKRSSRIADKQEKERQEAGVRAAELKRQQELDMAHKEHDRQQRAERDRESRMMTREQRIKDREMRRILHEEELSKLEGRSQSVESGDARASERTRKTLLEKKQKDIEKLKQEEMDDWDFDCSVCGVHGKNIDDGTHSIACDKCGVWEHSSCHKITPKQAEQDDFKFVCDRCKKPKTGIKLKLTGQSSSPTSATNNTLPSNLKPVVQAPPPLAQGGGPPMGVFRPPSSSGTRPLSSGIQSNTVYAQSITAPPYKGAYPYSQASPSPATASQKGQFPQYLPPAQPPQPQAQPPSAAYPVAGYPSQQSLPKQEHSSINPTQLSKSGSGYSGQSDPTTSQAYQHVDGAHHMSPANRSQATVVNGASIRHQSNPPPKSALSLSATQGNTDVRFSPTTQPTPNSPSHHRNALNFADSPGAAQAYSPSSNRPAAGAFSPVKHVSPHPSPHAGTTPQGHVSLPLSTQQDSRRQVTEGSLSPSKKSAISTSPSSHKLNHSGQVSAPLIPAAPTLSPTVNVQSTNEPPPMKKMTPTKTADSGMLPSAAPHPPQLVNGYRHDQ